MSRTFKYLVVFFSGLVAFISSGVILLFAFFWWYSGSPTTRELTTRKSPDRKYEAVAWVETYGGMLGSSYYYVNIYALPRRQPLLHIFGGIGGSPRATVWTANEGRELKVQWVDNTHLSISCLFCDLGTLERRSWRCIEVSYDARSLPPLEP